MSVVLCGLLFAINPMLRLFGQPQSVLDALDGYYYSVTLSLIPYLIFLTFKQYLEGLGNTFYSMLITLGSNVLNVFLNFGFIYGYMGFPELGVTGAGVATLISRIMMPIVFIVVVYFRKEFRCYFVSQQTTVVIQIFRFSGSQIFRFIKSRMSYRYSDDVGAFLSYLHDDNDGMVRGEDACRQSDSPDNDRIFFYDC